MATAVGRFVALGAATTALGAPLSTGPAEASHNVARAAPLSWRTGPNGAYRMKLPQTWRFRNASYPSDHATHLWYDPNNPLRKMLVTLSGCIGCVTTNNYTTTPNPRGELPGDASTTYRLSPWKLAFSGFSTDDPYPLNGFVDVTHTSRGIDGSVIVELWLPQSQHLTATAILNSFAARQ